jgi:hypothetical protein
MFLKRKIILAKIIKIPYINNMNKTIITRRSPFTGRVNQMEIPLSPEEFSRREILWQTGELIQNAFPMLDAGQREFIKTGITPEEWDAMFGGDEEE